MVGIGVLVASLPYTPLPHTPLPHTPQPVAAEVRLASTEFALSPATDDLFWLFDGDGAQVFGAAGFTTAATPTPNALAAVTGGNLFRPIIGPGGWLIGDGLDADPDCEAGTDACNGGNGRIVVG